MSGFLHTWQGSGCQAIRHAIGKMILDRFLNPRDAVLWIGVGAEELGLTCTA
jgi:hypothetical protein